MIEEKLKEYVIRGGQIFSVIDVSHYRDGVMCLGGMGTVVVETNMREDCELLITDEGVKSKGGKIYTDKLFLEFLHHQINRYARVVEDHANRVRRISDKFVERMVF